MLEVIYQLCMTICDWSKKAANEAAIFDVRGILKNYKGRLPPIWGTLDRTLDLDGLLMLAV